MKHDLGDIWDYWGITRRKVRVIGGYGAYAYWIDPNKYTVIAGFFDANRVDKDMAGSLLSNNTDYSTHRDRVINLQFTVTLNMENN